ncbi:HIT-like protein [Thelephora ganbajun]|uniref:HIT-like protein n=1 Tax=Thelephora ganbajun TaxID=370292 RepID=A0ACB6ZWQ0_THEGA|nr:HIT-like protein [Thelephora ganbajun]
MSAPAKLFFSTIEVTKQAFYRSPLSYAIVNLKPIVPGHVLVIPTRPVPRISDLTSSELTSLMESVKTVGTVVEKAYHGDGLTVACQDGPAAGQTIPHVHFHILPRKLQGDIFQPNRDAVYPAIEEAESELHADLEQVAESLRRRRPVVGPLKMDADMEREPRELEEMVKEAEWLRSFFEAEKAAHRVD